MTYSNKIKITLIRNINIVNFLYIFIKRYKVYLNGTSCVSHICSVLVGKRSCHFPSSFGPMTCQLSGHQMPFLRAPYFACSSIVLCQPQHLLLAPPQSSSFYSFHPFRGLNHVKISSAVTWHVCFCLAIHITSAKCKLQMFSGCPTPKHPPPTSLLRGVSSGECDNDFSFCSKCRRVVYH